jgi:Flp pilus assembly pilin Flp
LEDGPSRRMQTASVGESRMKNLFNRFVREEQGQDLIEYALLTALITLIGAATIAPLGTTIAAKWTAVNTLMSASS